MSEILTDRDFWLKYWENKTDLVQTVTENNYFSPLFKKIFQENPDIQNCIEIGGFPGYFSVYLKKYFHINPTLLDYVIHNKLVSDLLEYNHMKVEDLSLLEVDLFNDAAKPIFDLTLSSGFIEHFSDTVDLIQRHANYTKPGGIVFIIVPNFLGLNGWLNKKYDYSVYEKHYLACMEKNHLKDCAVQCGLEDIKTFYYGKMSIWLENIGTKGMIFRFLFKLAWILGKIFTKVIPVETKLLSPYTILLAKKK